MEVFFDGIPLHPNCMSLTLNYEDGTEKTIDWYECERCNNRKTNSAKKLPVNPNTFCAECKEQYKYMLIATQEW